ncbi:MAG: hypothetical protein FJY55_02220 [Betaproteobacteria bacterium]|nr:hypothetical protein [Betaproteobacteria bacterium]
MSLVRSQQRLIAIPVCTFLGACAANPHNKRARLAAPTFVSAVYSDTSLRLMLAVTPNAEGACQQSVSPDHAAFDRRVAETGARLSEVAFRTYPQLADRVAAFRFSVEEKVEPATASTANGLVVVMRGASKLAPDDETLSFLLAREIGHVVAQHHEETTGTSLVVSALSTLFLPVANVAKYLGTLFSGVSTPAASVSVTVASFAGSRVLAESYRPRQLEEADDIAVALLQRHGIDPGSIARHFSRVDLSTPQTRWVSELSASVQRVAFLAARAEAAKA